MKLSKIIYYSLVLIFTILCFYISVEVVVAFKDNRPVSVFNHTISYVPTDSMEEEIMAGDYILYKNTEFSKIDVEDIIIYKSKSGDMAGKYIVHRVIEEHDDYFITQGDNNPLPDEEKITSDMVIGEYVKVIKVMRGLGSNRDLLIILVFVIVILTLGSQVLSYYINKKKSSLKEANEKEKQELLEQLKQEILKEELEKIKNSKK